MRLIFIFFHKLVHQGVSLVSCLGFEEGVTQLDPATWMVLPLA